MPSAAKATAGPAAPPAPPPEIPIPPRRFLPHHRAGAWKVAYADFVTALMALFITLWTMNSSSKVKQAVSGYFQDPRGYARRVASEPAAGEEETTAPASSSADALSELRTRIEQTLRQSPEFAQLRDNIKLSVTSEGLRIDLLENEKGMFFETGNAHPTAIGERLLKLLAAQISRMQNMVVVEGHTDALPFRNAAPATGYTNWDLSTDRANAARRLLETSGLRTGQVVELRGFADRRLLNSGNPNDPRNRRISVVVEF